MRWSEGRCKITEFRAREANINIGAGVAGEFLNIDQGSTPEPTTAAAVGKAVGEARTVPQASAFALIFGAGRAVRERDHGGLKLHEPIISRPVAVIPLAPQREPPLTAAAPVAGAPF